MWSDPNPFFRAHANSQKRQNLKKADGSKKSGQQLRRRRQKVDRRVPMREFSRSLPMSLLLAREAVMLQFLPFAAPSRSYPVLRNGASCGARAASIPVEVTEHRAHRLPVFVPSPVAHPGAISTRAA